MNRTEIIEKYIRRLEEIAADNSHGYDNRVNHNLGHPDYDCGAYVSDGLRTAGLIESGTVFEPNQPYGDWGYDTILTKAGFKQYPFSVNNLQRGDILIKDGHHTEVYIGSGMQIGAHDNYDGVEGDWVYGTEIGKVALSQNYWDYIYRLEEKMARFKDVPEDYKYHDYIEKAAEAGIMKGYEDGCFHPEKAVTREEIAIIVARLLDRLK